MTNGFHIDRRSSIKNTNGKTSLVVHGFEDFEETVFRVLKISNLCLTFALPLDTCITSRVKGRHHFRAQNSPKKVFDGITFFNGKIYFSGITSPF